MRTFCLLLFWICLLGSCHGLRYVFERGNLEVTNPESLQGFYDSSLGRFGTPALGGLAAGIVVYPEVNKGACSGFAMFDISFRPRLGDLPVILLVDRGQCFFAAKVINAQMAGAVAVVIVDDFVEPLITMEVPQVDVVSSNFLQAIDIPSALISKSFGDKIKEALSRDEMVYMAFNPPNKQVKVDLWINGNLGCGPKCEEQLEFVQNFREVVKSFEEGGYTQFTPHFVTWYCPEAFILSRLCKSQCINHGRYCAPDPQEELFDSGCKKQTDGMIRTGCYRGRDIVIQSLVQACIHKIARESGKPLMWWDYVNDFASQCSMKNALYGMSSCRNGIIWRLGLEIEKVYECVGDTEADQEHPLLRAEQDARIERFGRGKDASVVPSLVINGNHYRGKLVKEDVLKAICAAINNTRKPDICPKVIPEEAKQEIVLADLHEAARAIIPAGLELVNREVALESRKEDEEMEARPARDIPWTWSWKLFSFSGSPEMEDMADRNKVGFPDQDKSGLPGLVDVKEGDHVKESDLVSTDTGRRSMGSD